MNIGKKPTIDDFTVQMLYHDGKPYVSYIAPENVAEIMGPALYEEYQKWSRGQTRIGPGDFPWDVEAFLNGWKPLD